MKVQNIEKQQISYFKSKFESASGKYDLYVLFIENALKNLINKDGQIVFINPHRFMIAEYGKNLREYLIKERSIKRILVFGVNQIFDEATTYTGIFFFSKDSKNIGYCELETLELSTVSFKQYEFSRIGSVWSFKNDNSADLLLKITKHRLVKNIFQGIFQGLISMGDDIQMLEGEIKNGRFVGYSKKLQKSVEIESTLMKPVLKGEHIQRYAELKTNTYIIYPHIENEKHKTIPFEEPSFKISYPLGYEYLLNFESYLKEKKTKYKTNPKYWFTLHRSRELSIFNTSKIITPQLQNKASFTIDNSSYFPDAGGYMIVKKDNDSIDLKTYLGIFNSSLFYYFIKQTSTPYNNNYYYFKTNYIQEFSIPEISESVQSLIMETVESVISLKNQGKDTYLIEKKIDSLVYDLYNLTHDEISIIEQCL